MIVLLALVYLIKFFAGDKYGGSGIEISEFYLLLPYVLIFNVLCYGFSIAIGKFADLRIRDAFTIAIEVALHNTTLALLVASTLLNNEDMAKPAMIYLLFSFWTALIFGYLTIKFKRIEFEEDVHMRKHN